MSASPPNAPGVTTTPARRRTRGGRGPHPRRPSARTQVLAATALVAFAANSLLARPALGTGLADPATYTAVRLFAGAVTLAMLVRSRPPSARHAGRGGTWASAAALFAYAILFSAAYVRVEAGLGAFVLFGAVQITMIGWGMARGERPGALEWAGVATAVAGLFWLTSPGSGAPDVPGTIMMAAAGVAWGAYSLRGRDSGDPLRATAGNFSRGVPFAAAVLAAAVVFANGLEVRATRAGVLLAVASGAVASGLGYTAWYAALPGLSGVGAASAQLSVPVLTGVGAVLLLGEAPTWRLVGAGGLILAGIALALFGRRSTGPGRR